MAVFWKAVGAVMVALVLALAIGKQEKDFATVLTMTVCCITVCGALTCLEPVVDFLHHLERLGNLPGGAIGVLLKIVGIGLVTETATLICQDSGQSSLGKGLQILGSSLILGLSLPVMEAMLDLIQSILGEL